MGFLVDAMHFEFRIVAPSCFPDDYYIIEKIFIVYYLPYLTYKSICVRQFWNNQISFMKSQIYDQFSLFAN